jgi:hypothetical protein
VQVGVLDRMEVVVANMLVDVSALLLFAVVDEGISERELVAELEVLGAGTSFIESSYIKLDKKWNMTK